MLFRSLFKTSILYSASILSKKANIFDPEHQVLPKLPVIVPDRDNLPKLHEAQNSRSSIHAPNAAVRIHRISNRRSLINAPRTLCTRGRIYELIKKKRKMGTAEKKGSVPRTQKGKAPIPPLQHLLHSALYNFVFERSLALPPSLTLSSPPSRKGGKGRARHPCSSVMTVIAGKRQPPGTKAKGRPHRWDYRRFLGSPSWQLFPSLAMMVFIAVRVFKKRTFCKV